jgi:hypothetical protein
MVALYAPDRRRPAYARSTSFNYLRWWCSPSSQRLRYECLVRQRFMCGHCGYLLNPKWFDTHHNTYANLGYEESSDAIAVHRRCHRILEEQRRNACGCAPMAA